MVEVEERSSRIAYDAWHRLRPVDSDTDTPWHRLIKKYLRPADIDGKSILEIGCGRGGFSCWLAAHDPPPVQLAAADFSPAAVSIGREFADSVGFRSIRWNVADIQHLPYADSTFDTVISAETIEHVPDPRLAIAELARVLKPGGHLLLTTPNYMNLFGLYRIYLRLAGRPYTEMGQPLNHFVMLPLTRRWVSAANLEIVHIDSSELLVPIPGRHPLGVRPRPSLQFLQKWFGLQSLVVARKSSLPAR